MNPLETLEFMGLVCHKGGGGGGGNSGKVSWPSYLQNRHKAWLEDNDGKDMDAAIDVAFNHSPYIGLDVYSPDDELSATQARYDAYKNILPSDTELEWDRQVDVAAAKIDEISDLSDAGQAELVEQFDRRQMLTTRRGMARFAAMLADVGGDRGSAYAVGMVALTMEHDRAVDQYRTELMEQARRDRLAFIQNGVGQLAQGRTTQLEQFRMAAHMMAEINRVAIVANREYDDARIKVLVNDKTWNMEIFKYAGNLLASVQGGIAGGGGNEAAGGGLMSSLGGALSGAAGGAMAGSVIPGIGTTVGAIAGGALGGIGAFLA